MSAENNFIIRNSRGKITLTKQLIEESVFRIAVNSSNFIVKKVKFFDVEKYNQKCFIIEMLKKNKIDLYENDLFTLQNHLVSLIIANIHIINFNLILVFE